MSATVLILSTGTVTLLLLGKAALGTPLAWFTIFNAVLNALANPVPEAAWPATALGAPMCSGSVAKPASAKAVTAVLISFIATNVTPGNAALGVALAQLPTTAISVAAWLAPLGVPIPLTCGSPPTEYR